MFERFTNVRLVLTVLALLVAGAVLLNQFATTSATASAGEASVIVELHDDPAAVYKARTTKSGNALSAEGLQAYRDGLRAKQDEFLNALAASGVNATLMTRDIKGFDGKVAATVPLRYTLVYNGVALKISSGDIGRIKSMPQVKRVSLNQVLFTSLHKSVDYTNATKVYGAVKELSQFDELRRDGYEGQGMYVSIIDTGIDWTHPMFGGDPTPPRLGVAPPTPAATNTNKKVVYYIPFTDIGVQDGFGHGTHVASTVGGFLAQTPGSDGIPTTADDVRLHGVAPQAKLLSYKVCSDAFSSIYAATGVALGGCASADTIMAIEDSVSPFTITGFPKPVANVINMSLGGSGGPDNPTAVAASNAALAGTTVVAASGNSGPGEATTGSPAAGTHVISVGATTHPGASNSIWSADLLQAGAVNPAVVGAISPAKNLPAASGFARIKLFPMAGTPNPPAGAMAQRYVFIDNLAGPWPASVSGRIALIRNPGLTSATFFDVSQQAAASGAVGVLNISDVENATAVTGSIPSANILPADGELLVDAISSSDDNNVDPANGTLSELPLRMNPTFSDTFMGEMGGFSSRGPVQGLGQVKPDVSAPGVAVLAACPPGSLLGALAAAGTPTAPNYIAIDGTSMATPHVAGAAALIMQANPGWTPDVVRTVLINTATNMRDQAGTPKADGHTTADSIIAQGGGLMDVKEAVNAKAVMGVAGDGITKPGILGSHSFGEVPVINSRVTNTSPINVTIRDLSGQGGTYNLAVANNRDLQLGGISVSVSQSSVTVPAGGEATFTVNATVDGDALRDVMASKTYGSQVIFERIQMQWFITANSSSESLRMPFFFRPGNSLPAEPVVQVSSVTDVMPAGDSGAQRDTAGFQSELNGVTYKDIPFQVDSSTLRIEALTEWMQVAETGHPDIDYQLLGPDGEIVTQSGNGVGPEYVNVNVSQPGTYTHRVIGFTSVGTEFTVTTTLTKGNTPPALQAVSADFTDAQGSAVDFDGNLTLNWDATGVETGFEVERSTDGANFEPIGTTTSTSLTLSNQPEGDVHYRVRGIAPGQIGSYVTAPSNASTVRINRRTQVDITSLISTAMSNVSFSGGVFKMDLNIKNNSANSYVPLVELKVIGISSTSGTVTVKNADNGGNGKSVATAALFGYSNLLGSDQQFSAAEITGNRNLEFNDSAAEMFSFDVNVTAFEQVGGAGAGAGAAPQGGASAPGSGSSEGSLLPLTKKLRITVNPLTKVVTAKLL